MLNVSSIRGKERKLAFSTNERLRSFKPPFLKPSFVKLDSLTQVKRADWSELQVLHNGATLDQGELDRIKKLLVRKGVEIRLLFLVVRHPRFTTISTTNR